MADIAMTAAVTVMATVAVTVNGKGAMKSTMAASRAWVTTTSTTGKSAA
jgi:hypothetical protein